jgi:cell division protein FtsI (penicillin-binding protein 3)
MSSPPAPIDQFQRRSGVVLLVGASALLLALGGRLVYINTTLRDRLLTIAERQQQGGSTMPARRGMVLDARGRVVAATEQRPDVFVDPARVEDLDEFAQRLSPRVNIPAVKIAEKIRRRPQSRFVVIASGVDDITAEAVRAMRDPAVNLSERLVRTYPLGESIAHVLGWVGRDGAGLEGIEAAFDGHLRGKDGWRGTIRDARRRALRPSDEEMIPPADGGHVVLTIDAEIQRIAEQALAESIKRVEAENGIAIVMSPQTGEILAMACYPTFDPNDPGSVLTDVRRNRAVTDPVEPGSTFKPFIVCGALDGSHISATELIDCHMGTRTIGSRTITDVKPHGMMDVKGIITHSSNIGMSMIADRMGNLALHNTIRRFGFGTKTGVECPGEADGVVYPLKRWSKLSTASVGMGYEVMVTPLQLISGFSTILNDGVMLKPRIVKRLLRPSGEAVKDFESPQIVGRVVSSRVAHYVAGELLVSVVENGSGRGAKLEHYRVLGKTGTAKLTYKNRGEYEPGAYLGAFVGAAPVERPALVAMVMIRRPNPRVAYYGSAVAAPVVGEILGQALPYLGVPPDNDGVAAAIP